ncbi:hypothetical protein L248_2220 [Schleiferilactobacillus shenzhenensis LY-73]|uniref:Uncharacterized protein n=1 Tax=Schleiferilactobacillus shenzhenensis LY-73 TaxID=1231336 RepID=U4TG53_9LACO|nr:hypothetical protein L248_2220 [Schleiferilactobacillus shenzhenensis LY-73]
MAVLKKDRKGPRLLRLINMVTSYRSMLEKSTGELLNYEE